jgi:hypothetical protein
LVIKDDTWKFDEYTLPQTEKAIQTKLDDEGLERVDTHRLGTR